MNEDLLKIARTVADVDVLSYEGDAGDNIICPFCDGDDDHLAIGRSAAERFKHGSGCIKVLANRLKAEGKI